MDNQRKEEVKQIVVGEAAAKLWLAAKNVPIRSDAKPVAINSRYNTRQFARV